MGELVTGWDKKKSESQSQTTDCPETGYNQTKVEHREEVWNKHTSTDHLCPRQEEVEGSDDAERMRWHLHKSKHKVKLKQTNKCKVIN